MIKSSVIWGLLSAGLLAVPVAASRSLATTVKSGSPIFATVYGTSASQAGQTAIHAVGGGQILHVSSDTYQGQAVYDIHVLYRGTVYDVKIAKNTGAVVQKKLSSEQPRSQSSSAASRSSSSSSPAPSPSHGSSSAVNSSQAGQLAVQAVGGGTVMHVSADHYQGQAVWDVHVLYQNQLWDVKISQSSGSVLETFLSPEQNPGSASQPQSQSSDSQGSHNQSPDSKDQPDHQTSSSSGSNTHVVYGQKLTSVPVAYQQYVNQALAQENGTLKWIKLIHKHQGETQANIKIRRNQGGTVKIKDLFSASEQLIQQKINN